jgi:hypothetical protein
MFVLARRRISRVRVSRPLDIKYSKCFLVLASTLKFLEVVNVSDQMTSPLY